MSKLVVGQALKDLMLQHCVPAVVRSRDYGWHSLTGERFYRRGFYKVVKPLHVFKKVYYHDKRGQPVGVIANLIIPVGAMIYTGPYYSSYNTSMADRKMRASEAYVHSIVTVRSLKQLNSAFSGHDDDFIYKPGKTVKPTTKFSKQPDQCDSGIHFFVNLKDAKDW